ncbi:MAG: hypothetical protein AB8E15_00135 [Bdellovibrionales bacterium]
MQRRVSKQKQQMFHMFMIIVFLFTSSPGAVYGQQAPGGSKELFKEPLPPSASDLEGDGLSEEEKEKIEKSFLRPSGQGIQNLKLITKLESKIQRIEKKIGRDSLIQKIQGGKEQDRVRATIPGVGYAETLDLGKGTRAGYIYKVVNEISSDVTLVVDFKRLPLEFLESDHESKIKLRHFIALKFRLWLAQQSLRSERLKQSSSSIETQEQIIESRQKLAELQRTVDTMSADVSEKWKHKIDQDRKKYLGAELNRLVANMQINPQEFLNSSRVDPVEVQKRLEFMSKLDLDELKQNRDWHSILKKPGAIRSTSMTPSPLGPDVTLIFLNGGEFARSTHVEAPRVGGKKRFLSGSFWNRYVNAVWEKPEKDPRVIEKNPLVRYTIGFLSGDYLIGTFFATAQMSAAFGMGMIFSSNSDIFTGIGWANLVFGFSLGVMTKVFQNWNYLGGKLSRNAKSWLVAVSFGLLAYGLSDGKNAISPVKEGGGLNFEALNNYRIIIVNTVIKGFFKVYSQEWPKYQKEAGQLKGNLTFKIGSKTFDVGVDRAGVALQSYQFLGTIPKMVHLAGTSFSVAYMNSAGEPVSLIIPVGFLVYLSGVPLFHAWVEFMSKRFTYKHSRGSKHIKEFYERGYQKGTNQKYIEMDKEYLRQLVAENFDLKYETVKNMRRYQLIDILNQYNSSHSPKPYSRLSANEFLDVLEKMQKHGYSLRVYEKAAIKHRREWEESKYYGIPYLRTIGKAVQYVAYKSMRLITYPIKGSEKIARKVSNKIGDQKFRRTIILASFAAVLMSSDAGAMESHNPAIETNRSLQRSDVANFCGSRY